MSEINGNIAEVLESIDPLEIRKALFLRRDFDFIVKGIANNGELIGQETTHEKQREALNILTSNKYEQFLYGGAAGGAKSWTGVSWCVFSALCYPGTRWFIARNELKDLTDSVMVTFGKVCAEYGIKDYKFNAVKNIITFGNGSVINLIEVKYKPSDKLYEDVGSTEYTGGWFEEIGEINKKAVSVLQTRVGRHLNGKYGLKGIVFLTCNPKRNWAKTDFYDKHISGQLYKDNEDPNKISRIYLNCLVTENPFIEEDYIMSLRKQASDDKSMYERLFKGNWDYEDNPFQLADQEMIEIIFENNHVPEGTNYITADIARYGSDKAVIIAWSGWRIKEVITFDISKTTDISHAIMYLRNKYRVPKTRCIGDSDGVGGGVIDESGIKGFVNGARPIKEKTVKGTPNYRNLQIQCLYLLAKKINEGGLFVEAELENKVKEDIKTELAQIHSKPNKTDATKLDCKTKAEIKSDIGRSPDYRDAIFMRIFFDLKPARRKMTSGRKRGTM